MNRYCLVHAGLIGTPQKWLHSLSELPNLTSGDKVDLFVHTWDYDFNLKNLDKFLREYRDSFNIYVRTEKYTDSFLPNLLKYSRGIDPGENSCILVKKFAIFHSLYRAYNSILDPDNYRFLIKVQCYIRNSSLYIHPDQGGEYPEWRYNATNVYPLLQGTDYRDFVYAQLTYSSLSSRQFYSGPSPVIKTFLKDFDEYVEILSECFYKLYTKAGTADFEGSMLLRELFEYNGVKILTAGGIKTGQPVDVTPHLTPSSILNLK